MAKSLQITDSKIIVSANQYDPRGWLARHEVKGILPGCRKNVTLTFSTSYARICVGPLFGYNGRAYIRPSEWAELVQRTPIVVDRFAPMPLTDEIRTRALADAMRTVTCESVTNCNDVHPSFSVTYDPLEVL